MNTNTGGSFYGYYIARLHASGKAAHVRFPPNGAPNITANAPYPPKIRLAASSEIARGIPWGFPVEFPQRDGEIAGFGLISIPANAPAKEHEVISKYWIFVEFYAL